MCVSVPVCAFRDFAACAHAARMRSEPMEWSSSETGSGPEGLTPCDTALRQPD